MTTPVRIAMLDSGVFTGNAHIERPVQGGVTITSEGEYEGFEDTLGHGTAVCALLQKMAPDADLFAVKVFDRRLATTATNVLRAIDWCIRHEIDVINLSLGTANPEHKPLFRAAVERVRATGATLVSAYEVNGTPMLPGSLPGVVGVIEAADCPRETYRLVDDGAPRVAACPYPLDIAGIPRERNIHGVSFAVAHVSAHIARLRARGTQQDWATYIFEADCVPPRAV
jgi:subtilisin family serine protease